MQFLELLDKTCHLRVELYLALELLLRPLVSIEEALDVDLANADELALQHLVETVVVGADLMTTRRVILHRVLPVGLY